MQVNLTICNLAKYMGMAHQPFLLLDVHVKGQHLQKLAECVVKVLDLNLKSAWLHFYTINDSGAVEPIERV